MIFYKEVHFEPSFFVILSEKMKKKYENMFYTFCEESKNLKNQDKLPKRGCLVSLIYRMFISILFNHFKINQNFPNYLPSINCVGQKRIKCENY